jgi:NADPH:quinone reductase-like Zn-dependent oxidoreductase
MELWPIYVEFWYCLLYQSKAYRKLTLQLAVLMRFIIPIRGLLHGRLAVSETLVVMGATGAYGGAAVLLAIAMVAGRMIAAPQRGGT